MLAEVVFYLSVACLFNHELDAIQQGEWRFFFGWLPLGDNIAYQLFVIAHVPLFLFVLMFLPQTSLRISLSLFMLIHAGLHWYLRHHSRITFNQLFSQIWIYGAAGFGLLYLILQKLS